MCSSALTTITNPSTTLSRALINPTRANNNGVRIWRTQAISLVSITSPPLLVQLGKLTQPKLDNHQLDRASNLPNQELNLDKETLLSAGLIRAVLAAAVATILVIAAGAGKDNSVLPCALGKEGGGRGESAGDGVEVGGEGGGGGVLLVDGGVVLDRGGGGVW